MFDRSLRLMTYNVHSCVGPDGKLSVERVADAIGESAPDVVTLQEIDVCQRRSGGVDQGEVIAERLGMQVLFASARETDGGRYGNAILSRYPVAPVREGPLPSKRASRALEPRAAQWAKLAFFGHEVHLVNTHLSLDRKERLSQARALLGSDWVQHPDCASPLVVCGDFNSIPWSSVYRAMSQRLVDTRRQLIPRFSATFPAWLPIFRLDYVFVSPGVLVRSTKVPWTPRTRAASDHLPLVVELAFGSS